MKIGAVLMAAGASERFGDADKLMAEIDGEPLIRRALAALEASSVADIVVVLPPDAEARRRACGVGRWRFATNGGDADGMAASLRTGLSGLNEDCAGALVALADMPLLSAALIDDLCAAFASCDGQAIVFPERPDGRQGHPVLWPRAFFAALSELKGDEGGKPVLLANRDAWHPVPIADEAAFFDVDTPADLSLAQKIRR